MNNYVLLKNGHIKVISHDVKNGYFARPVDVDFNTAQKQNLFTFVNHTDVCVIDTNMSVIKSYQSKLN